MSDKQTEKGQLAEDDQAVSENSESADLAFLELDESGTVDLDALFDALNIAAEENSGAMKFVEGSDGDSTTLTISGTDLILGNVTSEDLPDATDLLFKSNIVSDES